MSNFNFKNPPYTNPEQSKKLLDLGLDKNTADFYCTILESGYTKSRLVPEGFEFDGDDIPQWSISRLLEMIPHRINIKKNTITDTVPDEDFTGETLIDSIIELIEFQIMEDYFCEDYISTKYLRISDELVYFDGIQVFLAEDQVRNYYIGLAQHDFSYLVVKLENYKPIKELLYKADLRKFFTEGKLFFFVDSISDVSKDECFIVTKIDKDSITEDMLPGEGFILN